MSFNLAQLFLSLAGTMKGFTRHISRLMAVWLLMGLVLISFNQAYFGHIHHLPDGETIFHAHPYQKQPDSKPLHQHSAGELLFLQQFQDLLWLIWTGSLLVLVVKPLMSLLVYYSCILKFFGPCLLQKNKSPPTVSFC
ncbi:MAG: hypothetical protein ACNS62_06955 [Candidatus Cyclobacteriaceae bacterium M3_2C_046]